MEQLKTIKEQLIAQVQSQMGDLKCVDTKELGEVIDMIKDLSEAVYYCEIYDQMKDSEESRKEQMMTRENNNYYYTERYYDSARDMDRGMGRMYYSSPSSSSGSGTSPSSNGGNSGMASNSSQSMGQNSSSYYTERDYPVYLRDEREGRSPMKRKMYMESKTTGQDSSKTIKELESYMQDLTSDMMDLLGKASPEEKAIVQKKMNTLAAKIQNV